MVERSGAHLIVLGNEKGGSGKTTTAFHLAIQLLYQGYNVATIDTDSRQQTFTHYVKNRRNWARKHGVRIPHTTHYHLPIARSDSQKERERIEFSLFRQAVGEVERHADFLIVDTPGFDTHLTRLSHSLADTLITPLNDSFVDFDLLAHVDTEGDDITGPSVYSEMVWNARQLRSQAGLSPIDWVVVRNRMGAQAMVNKEKMERVINKLAKRIGFRTAPGFNERVIFRELFPRGLTLLDLRDLGVKGMNISNVAARNELRGLIAALNLPGVEVDF